MSAEYDAYDLPHGAGQGEMDDLEVMKRKMAELEEETKMLHEMQDEAAREMNFPHGAGSATSSRGNYPDSNEKEEIDRRSIYVGNVDYSVTPEQLQELFQACGVINRVTIMADKFTGQPKGYAYIEFAETAAVAGASALDGSEVNGRALKVNPKRTNVPGLGRGRGRGRGGRGGYHNFYPPPPYPYYYGHPPPMYPPGPMGSHYQGGYPHRGGRGGYRGRGRQHSYAPY
jgi:polyadenylate-binding protein 2